MRRTSAFFLVIATVAAVFGFSKIVLAAGTATISLSPTTTSVDTGEDFTLSVLVDPNGESLDTVRVNMSYDPTLLEAIRFDLGTQFPSLSPGYEIDNTAGALTYGGYKYGTQVTAEGTFATVTFRALSSGTAAISITSDSKAIDDGTEKVDVSELGSATITIAGDTVESTTPATTETTTTTDVSLEQQALVYFGAFYARMPSSGDDWSALHCIAYGGCKEDVQDVAAEQAALVIFGAKYAKMPSSGMEWNVIHTLAYTDFLGVTTSDDEEVVIEEPVVEEEEPVVEEEEETTETTLTAEQLAIGYFGTLTGTLPSDSADWEFVDIAAHGYSGATDASLEAEALSVFTSTFGRLPSGDDDWNLLKAIAYSGAIL
ncbi:TPA: hypothetical protein DEP34_04225 [Candidatus Uhrbacteria bacterium]|uniref:Cohesin domain-containing protein n=1 Tax=Candidatus Uhrbacteria bacterium GW2011_GWF2_46_218 TaxID=1619001 RepID=A0A0G1PH39_9BACT|nr:MAG: hypothetical protein UX45_C0024G0008 [Candidatus Uhrbacteria bacterium GW2011_GWF2_46_218]HCB19556.1 hypothetical protein [Candidatus Uhrbacteria bacterium]